jgi:hypothetical protein
MILVEILDRETSSAVTSYVNKIDPYNRAQYWTGLTGLNKNA